MKCANVAEVSEQIFNEYLESLTKYYEKFNWPKTRRRPTNYPGTGSKWWPSSVVNQRPGGFRLSPIQGLL